MHFSSVYVADITFKHVYLAEWLFVSSFNIKINQFLFQWLPVDKTQKIHSSFALRVI